MVIMPGLVHSIDDSILYVMIALEALWNELALVAGFAPALVVGLVVGAAGDGLPAVVALVMFGMKPLSTSFYHLAKDRFVAFLTCAALLRAHSLNPSQLVIKSSQPFK
jgi:hypothetical protein